MNFFEPRALAILHLQRDAVAVRLIDGTVRTFQAVMTLSLETSDTPNVLAVEMDAEAMSLAVAKAHREGKLPLLPRITQPGEEPAWDPFWKWPPKRSSEPLPRPQSYLVIWPLRSDSWSPALVTALVRYTLVASAVRPSLLGLRPLLVQFSNEFTPLERAELFDAVVDMPERFRVRAQTGTHLPPAVPTALDRKCRLNRVATGLVTLLLVLEVVFLRFLWGNTFLFIAAVVPAVLLLFFLDHRRKHLESELFYQARRRARPLQGSTQPS